MLFRSCVETNSSEGISVMRPLIFHYPEEAYMDVHDLLGNPVTIVEKQEITAAEVAEILRTMDSNPVVALVTDNAPIPSKDQLVKTLQGMLSLKVFSNVQPNPRTVDIDAIQDDIGDCNVVIGIGGGSVLDTAKAIAMFSLRNP